MKNIFRISGVILLILLTFQINSCKKGKPPIPVLTTTDVSSITKTMAISGGNITYDGGETIISRGVCWSIKNTPTIGDNKTLDGAGAGNFVSTITELVPNTTYFVRAYATNSSGIGYGMAMSFITQPATIPVLTTTNITSITQTSASCGGTITSDGAVAITTRGVCWSTSQNPTITDNITSDGNGIGIYSSTLNGLIQNTTYFVRAYATNSAGTGYGNTLSFATQDGPIIFNPNLTYGSVTDIDDNVYKTITIGIQVWMAENLKTTKYHNGDIIGTTNPIALNIRSESSPKYQWAYEGDESNVANYGRLYTWYSATDSRNVCPAGWHVPTDAEWSTLTTYLGGEWVAGGSLKETSTAHWKSPNTGATNGTGFTALPGGYRDGDGDFVDIGGYGHWWSSTIGDNNFPWERCLLYIQPEVNRARFDKEGGFSIRCLRDN